MMLNVSVNTPLQLGLADLIYSRAYREHLTTLKPILMAQVEQYRQFIITAFHQVDIGLNQPSGGYAFWIQLPEQIDGLEMYHFAQQQGFNIVPGEFFVEEEAYRNVFALIEGHNL